jgi:hypothetical protein
MLTARQEDGTLMLIYYKSLKGYTPDRFRKIEKKYELVDQHGGNNAEN